MKPINPNIFKAYDIRGRFPEDFNENDLENIISAYLKIISTKLSKPINTLKISIGKDIRTGSEIIHSKTIELLVAAGVSVTNFNLVSVNDLYFSVGYYNFDGGLMATASHNPAGYAGLKMAYYNGNQPDGLQFVSGEEIKNNLQPLLTKAGGIVEEKNLFTDHVNWLLNEVDVTTIKPMKVVIDTGGGMNILLLKELVKFLPIEVFFVNSEFDSTFSKRAPNPLEPGATQEAKKVLLETRSDLGLIYDIDGDRFFMLDETGELIKGDMTLLVIAEQLLKQKPKSGIAYNAVCSKSVPEKIMALSGVPVRAKVGYKNLSEAMKNNNGLMSGEVSSHFAFANSWYADSAFLATLIALQSVSQTNLKLSEVVKQNQTWFRADEINIKVDNINNVLEMIKTTFSQGKIDELDGVTVDLDSWWFNVRGSNTEPLIRITVETKVQNELAGKQQLVLDTLKLI